MQTIRRLLAVASNLVIPVALAVLIATVFAMVNHATNGPESHRDREFRQVQEVSEHAEMVRQLMQDNHDREIEALEAEIEALRKRLEE